MTRVSSIAVALTLAVGALPVVGVFAPQVVQAAEQKDQKANKITTKAVAEPLKKAQAAMAAKQWDAALTAIKQAEYLRVARTICDVEYRLYLHEV